MASERTNWFLTAHPSEVIEAYAEDGSLHEAVCQEIIEELRALVSELDTLREEWSDAQTYLDATGLVETETEWSRKLRDRIRELHVAGQKAEAVLERAGYRRCDILACGCGSWHSHVAKAVDR